MKVSHRFLSHGITLLVRYGVWRISCCVSLLLLFFEISVGSRRNAWAFIPLVVIFLSVVQNLVGNGPSSPVSFDNEYYEDRSTKDEWTVRPVEPLHYERGLWRSVSTGAEIRFRGMNLPAKTPSKPSQLQDTQFSKDLFLNGGKSVSFVNRPFPLEEAPLHFRRLHTWGINLIRLTVTWEAVMHAGPGQIDHDYLNYLTQLVTIASQHGLYVIIDPHQDVWSRFSGGDGAPAWTLEAIGFDVASIHETGAAHLRQFHSPNKPPPSMLWTTNYSRLATSTMFTLFFAGDTYAPNIGPHDSPTKESYQEYLQRHYMDFMAAVAKCLSHQSNVLGFGSMNEPSNGMVGLSDLRGSLLPGPLGYIVGSMWDSMRLTHGGIALQAEYYSSPFVYHSDEVMNPKGKSVWKSPESNVWLKAGVYRVVNETTKKLELMRPHHFKFDGLFIEKFMTPFYDRVSQTIRSYNSQWVVFAEPHIDPSHPIVHSAPSNLANPNNFAWAPHWYDISTLILKRYSHWMALDVPKDRPVIMPYFVDRAFSRNLRDLKASSFGNMQVMVGEVGVPFDIVPNGDGCIKALDRTMQAVEANELDHILWCYDPRNTREAGDLWNGEDLSFRSQGRNRGLFAAVRPYIVRKGRTFVGCTQSQHFDPWTGTYHVSVTFPPTLKHNKDRMQKDDMTISIFLPMIHYAGSEPIISASYGTVHLDKGAQLIEWHFPRDYTHARTTPQTLTVSRGKLVGPNNDL